VLSVVVIVLGCALTALAYRMFTAPASAPAVAPRIGGGTSPLAPNLGGGDPCERAASCCETLLAGYGDASSCNQLRTMSRYGGAVAASCMQTYEMYRAQAEVRGLRCE
jgi:hypothetical protein